MSGQKTFPKGTANVVQSSTIRHRGKAIKGDGGQFTWPKGGEREFFKRGEEKPLTLLAKREGRGEYKRKGRRKKISLLSKMEETRLSRQKDNPGGKGKKNFPAEGGKNYRFEGRNQSS